MFKTTMSRLLLATILFASIGLFAQNGKRVTKAEVLGVSGLTTNAAEIVNTGDKVIMLYHDANVDHFSYAVVPNAAMQTKIEIQKDQYLPLENFSDHVMFISRDSHGAIVDLEIWNGVTWAWAERTMPIVELAGDINRYKDDADVIAQPHRDEFPTFEEVPGRPPCEDAVYCWSEWKTYDNGLRCLVDYYKCGEIKIGSVACCNIPGPTIPKCP